MHERPDLNEFNGASPDSEHKMSRQEAEDKVAEMFAAAKTQTKQSKKKESRSESDYEADFEAAERAYFSGESLEEPAGLFSRETFSKLRGRNKEDDMQSEEAVSIDELVGQELTPEEAEDKVAKMFAVASAKSPRLKSKGAGSSGLGLELAILESLSLFLFIASMSSGVPGPMTPAVILMPVPLGVGYRMLTQQMNLLEALSKCKAHIFIAAFFYLCLLLSI